MKIRKAKIINYKTDKYGDQCQDICQVILIGKQTDVYIGSKLCRECEHFILNDHLQKKVLCNVGSV